MHYATFTIDSFSKVFDFSTVIDEGASKFVFQNIINIALGIHFYSTVLCTLLLEIMCLKFSFILENKRSRKIIEKIVYLIVSIQPFY